MTKKSVLKDLLKIKQLVSDQNLMTGLYDQQLKSLDTAIDKVTPVKMPKVFDEWYSCFRPSVRRDTFLMIQRFQDLLITEKWFRREEYDLKRWFGDSDCKIELCLNAIVNGYEVEE